MASQPLNTMDNPLSQLVQQIDFAENEFALFFAQVDSPGQCNQWVETLQKLLESKGIRPLLITFSEPIQDLLTPVRQSLSDHKSLTSACVLILGLEQSIPLDTTSLTLLSHLNLARELYKKHINHPLVIWLPEYALASIARHAPDFWAWRSGVFDFIPAISYLETIQIELDKFDKATKALESLSTVLPSDQLEAFLDSFQEKQQRLIAQLSGSSAIAQGEGAIAVGKGSILIEGDVKGGIYIGQEPTSSKDALTNYCRFVIKHYSRLSLAAIDWAQADPAVRNRPELTDIYIDLDTKTFIEINRRDEARHVKKQEMEENRRPLSALEATIRNQQLVLLGEPGVGKSTFINFLAQCLAAQFLDTENKEDVLLHEWPEKETLPILITLRKFAEFLSRRLDTQPNPRILWDFITKELEAQNMSYVSEPIRQVLEQGKALVMFDGLDEVPREHIKFVRDCVLAFTKRYHTSRHLVTSRTLSYSLHQSDLYLPWATFELAPFDEQKIDRFVNAWYATLSNLGTIRFEDEAMLARRLQNALRGRRDLQQLAPNPLLLTVMALLNTSQGRLPESRSLLYEETTDILLWRWDMAKAGAGDEGSILRQLLMDASRTDVDLKRLLWQLAFETQAQSGDDYADMAGDISESKVMKSLATLKNNDYNWAQEMANGLKLRSGLLLERAPGVFSFPSRNLQEYYAGAHLTSQADFVTRCANLLQQEWHLWHEVILLATERLVFLVGDTSRPLALVGELCPNQVENSESYWRNVWLAGDILLAIGTSRVENYALGRDLISRVRHHLTDLLTSGGLSPIERARAGDTLGKLGDPRTDVSILLDQPNAGFVKIPAGPFVMGSKHDDEDAWDNEKPIHEVSLPTYYLARYPVTVAQFRYFVEDSGYQPVDQESLTGISNHPVVSISWYDALAYCEWLTNKLRSREGDLESLLRQGWKITLPSEAEWEKAARIDGRKFPWGDDFDSSLANIVEAGIGNTTAVGSFPGGASPYGLLDMAGNVWEWTRSVWGGAFDTPNYSYPYDPNDGRENLQASREIYRILRGGSFYENCRLARTTFRMSSAPGSWMATIGFRVAMSPVVL